MNRPQ
jgi:hypothetical protein